MERLRLRRTKHWGQATRFDQNWQMGLDSRRVADGVLRISCYRKTRAPRSVMTPGRSHFCAWTVQPAITLLDHLPSPEYEDFPVARCVAAKARRLCRLSRHSALGDPQVQRLRRATDCGCLPFGRHPAWDSPRPGTGLRRRPSRRSRAQGGPRNPRTFAVGDREGLCGRQRTSGGRARTRLSEVLEILRDFSRVYGLQKSHTPRLARTGRDIWSWANDDAPCPSHTSRRCLLTMDGRRIVRTSNDAGAPLALPL